MSEYGCCVQCGKEIDPRRGYSNGLGSGNQRSCIACQFPRSVRKDSFDRRRLPRFPGSGAVERIGISLGELIRRSRVADEAHAAGKTDQNRAAGQGLSREP